MHHRQQRHSLLGQFLGRSFPIEGKLRTHARVVHMLAVLAMVLGLYLPLVQDQAAASPSSPSAVSGATGQDAIGAPSQVIAIGDFQTQLGCGDGDTGCSATSLGESGGVWSAMLPMASGSYSVQFAVNTPNGQYIFGSGGEGGGPISFTVNDGQAGAWVAWNALTNEAGASGVDALYTVQTDVGSFIPEVDGGSLVVRIPSQGGSINVTLLANGEAAGPTQQVQVGNGWTEVTFDTSGNVVDVSSLDYGTLTIVRRDADGNPAPGGCYVLQDGGQVNQACDEDDGSSDGQTFMTFPQGFNPGTYTLEESRTPDGVDPIDDQQVSLDATDNVIELQPDSIAGDPGDGGDDGSDDGADDGTLDEPTDEPEFPTEEPADAQPGSLIVTLEDEQGNLIGGACWQLILDGNVVAETCDTNDANPFNGRAGFFNVPAGTYTLRMSQAPEGTTPTDDIENVEIEPGAEGNETVTIAMAPTEEPEAETGDVVVLRQDDDGNAVGGACFIIVDDGNTIVNDEVCDEDGDVADDGRTGFFDVPDGTWWIVETRTPDGYEAASPTQFSVVPGSAVEVDVRSAALDVEEPTTEPTDEPEFPTEEPTAEPTEEPVATLEPTEEPVQTGNLQVDLYDPDRNLVGGACWQLIQDDNVAAEACDLEGTADRFPMNGKVGLYDVPVGDYILRMSQVPDGFQQVADQDVTIEPGDALLEVTILPAEELVEPTREPTEEPEVPTEEPTQEPTEAPTEEPQPTDEPTQEPEPTDEPTEAPEATEEPGGLGEPGNLVITLQDADTNENVGGACFELSFDGQVTNTSCDANDDFPDNGRTGFFGVPSGTYILTMSQVPSGFEPIEPQDVTIEPGLGSTTEVTVFINASTVPTEVPTEQPADEPTEEPEFPADRPAGDITGVRVDVTQLDQSQGPICVELNTGSGISMRNPPSACDNGDGDADTAEGIILLEDVAPGTYSLFVRSGPQEAIETEWPPVSVQEGQVTDVVLTLDAQEPEPTDEPTQEPEPSPEPGAIEVQVEDANGDPIESEGTCLTIEGVTDVVCDNQEGDQNDDPGVLLIEGIAAGTWSITQTEAPEGFEVATDLDDVDVEEGETTDVTLNLNPTVGSIRIVAVDANQQPLPGACWAMYQDDAEIATQCDDNTNGGIANDGYATFANLVPGTFNLRQTQAPEGYLAVDNRDITVAEGENEPVFIEHEAASGTIIVTTVDGENATLFGACYSLDEGAEVCADDNGVVTFDDVAAGSHSLAQTAAPRGFNLAPARDVDVPPGSDVPVEIVNDDPLTGSVRIIVNLDGEALGGTCAGLIDAVTVCDNQPGDSDDTPGVILIDGVAPGDYTVALSNTPVGIEEPGTRDVTVEAEQEATATFDLVSLPPETEPLQVLVRDANGDPVANGCVVLSQENAVVYGPVCDNGDDDDDDAVGTIVFPEVEVGTYQASLTDESTATIEGFVSATAPSITVVEGAENATTITVELEAAATTGTIELTTVNNSTGERIGDLCYELRGDTTIAACDADDSDVNSLAGVIRLIDVPVGAYELVLTNLPDGYAAFEPQSVTVDGGVINSYEIRLDPLPDPATVTVLKVDPNDEPLPGACFAIVRGKVTIQSACDSSNGAPNDGTILFEGIPAGTYLLVETRAPSTNYRIASPIEFTVVAGEDRDIPVVNHPKPGRLVVTKVDAADSSLRLENACFALEGERNYGPFCDGDDGHVDGRTNFSNVAAGDYTLVETTAPAGYIPADDRDITIAPGGSVNIMVANQKAPPPEQTGELEVEKVDPDGERLAGACFRLFDGNAPVTAQVCDGTDGANDGTILFTDVPVGTWTLRETVTPSNNYQWADPVDVQIRNNRTTTVEIENTLKPGRVQINKTDPKGQPLQGACFDLQGDGRGEQCTNAKGLAVFSGLEPGTYSLVETRAPQGFDPVANVNNISVKPGQTTILNIVNQRTPPPPNTGSIQVQKFFCPAGEGGERTQFFGGAQGSQQLSRTAGCTRGDATFTLIEDDGEGGPGEFSTGADGQHQMTVPEGLYRLTEVDGESSVRVRISRGQMTTVIAINYVAPPEPEVASIEVMKFTCTPSFNGTLWEDFAENCSQENQLTNNITFRLEGPMIAKAVTGDGGNLGRTSFENLQPGTYTIHEERPVSIPVAYLFCGFDPQSPDEWKAVNGSLTIRIQYGQTLICQAYNIPADLTEDTGTILVHKYVCEIESAPKGYNWEEECRLSDQSASFSLAWFNSERQAFDEPAVSQANPDGLLWFTRLAPGTYQLREVDGAWCHAESNSVNAQGDVVVRANQLSEVWIYNCVPPDEPPNTGSGDAASNPPPATPHGGEDGPMALPAITLPMALVLSWFAQRGTHRTTWRDEVDRAA